MDINSDYNRLRGLWRGKCKDTGAFSGVWIIGLYQRRWDNFWSRWLSYIHRFDDIGNSTGVFEVDPETVGACVGFCDIDGKPIFEGDILKSENSYNAVIWNNDIASFVLSDGDDLYAPLCALDVQQNKIKVVGNIYDNPELLKKREDGKEPCMVNYDVWKVIAKELCGFDDETIAKLDALAENLREDRRTQ